MPNPEDRPEETIVVLYTPEPTPRRFHLSTARVRGIMGPVGTSKSVTCVMEIYMKACAQAAYNGMRRTRWAVVRNTMPQLVTTSIKTWKEWIPEVMCPISMGSPITGRMRQEQQDGTVVDMEVFFIALDTESDIRKFKSLELTGMWINEASEIDKAVLDMAEMRIQRFPPKIWGGFSWSGIIMDTNPPHNRHWWFNLAEKEKPEGYEFFRIPPAILPLPKKDPNDKDEPLRWGPNPQAENVKNLDMGYAYWLSKTGGKSLEWIRVFLMGQYGTVKSGKPVYPEYVDDAHCSKEPLKVYRGLPLLLGWDCAQRRPVCVIAQYSQIGQLRVLDEYFAEDMGIREFARNVIKPILVNQYSGMKIISTGDPAGAISFSGNSLSDERSALMELADAGIPTEPANTNSFLPRREAVAGFLNRTAGTERAFIMSPTCKMLRQGFQGEYVYPKYRIREGYSETPIKNEFSDPHDALQYIALRIQSGAEETTTDEFGQVNAPSHTYAPTSRVKKGGWT